MLGVGFYVFGEKNEKFFSKIKILAKNKRLGVASLRRPFKN